jgi:hypothetical protein
LVAVQQLKLVLVENGVKLSSTLLRRGRKLLEEELVGFITDSAGYYNYKKAARSDRARK